MEPSLLIIFVDAFFGQCHKTSEAHQRNMALYANNPGKFTGAYSKEFHADFMNMFKLQGGRRVLANSM